MKWHVECQFGEKNALDVEGVVQFERVGFVNLIKERKEIFAYFGHR